MNFQRNTQNLKIYQFFCKSFVHIKGQLKSDCFCSGEHLIWAIEAALFELAFIALAAHSNYYKAGKKSY